MEQFFADAGEAQKEAYILNMLNECGRWLDRLYPAPRPGYPWWIIEIPNDPDNEFTRQHGGTFNLRNMALDPNRAFVVFQDKLVTPDDRRKYMRWAGGEILERHGLPAGRVTVDQVESLKRNARGNTIHDTSK